MSEHDDSGPAFPSHGSMGEVAYEGMSLRQWYAGLALLAHISRYGLNVLAAPSVANSCLATADAMVKASKTWVGEPW